MIARLQRCYPRLQNIQMLGSELAVATGTDTVNDRIVLLKEMTPIIAQKTIDVHTHCRDLGVQCPIIHHTHYFDSVTILECEYVQGQDLMNLMLQNTKLPIMKIMLQLISRVQDYRKYNLSHLDIKPDNIVWDEDSQTLNIIDFESMRKHPPVGSNIISNAVGTSCYMSPELYYNFSYHRNTDLWNVGMVGLLLTMHCNPLSGNRIRRNDLQRFVLSEMPKTGVSGELINLISSLLHADPEKRCINLHLKSKNTVKCWKRWFCCLFR